MSTIEAADLARIILDDTETDRHMDLYTLTVIEARTLAHAVTRVKGLTDDREAEKDVRKVDSRMISEMPNGAARPRRRMHATNPATRRSA